MDPQRFRCFQFFRGLRGLINGFAAIATVATACAIGGCSSLTGSEPGVRTPGETFDDQVIEHLAKKEIKNADPGLADAHLVVVSHHGVVLLAGEVSSDNLKGIAQQAVESLSRVRRVHNELDVTENLSIADRARDSLLTSQVKTKMMWRSDVDAARINVTTHQRVVYLMGRVPRKQADGAVDAAQDVRGVKKIVKVFEYVD
jgi:osmotically-inducible protein OsmY